MGWGWERLPSPTDHLCREVVLPPRGRFRDAALLRYRCVPASAAPPVPASPAPPAPASSDQGQTVLAAELQVRYISPVSPLYLPYISLVSPLYLLISRLLLELLHGIEARTTRRLARGRGRGIEGKLEEAGIDKVYIVAVNPTPNPNPNPNPHAVP